MKKIFALVLFSVIFLSACDRRHAIVKLAEENLPAILDREMRYYNNTVETPSIEKLQLIYQNDSLCVLQFYSSARDAENVLKSETIRYIFVVDTFLSRFNGKPSYCHAIQGAPYLDKEGIAKFRKRIDSDPQNMYIKYLSECENVKLME